MANRFPLIINTASGNSVQEIPVGDFLDLSSSGISNSGNILVSGIISATGNITSAANISGAFLLGNASFVTGLSASKIFNGTSEANIGTSGGNANITIAGTSNVAVFASTGLFVNGTLNVSGNITSTGSNGVANIGSATTYFNTVHAKATSAQYADVAEVYQSDICYTAGTVVEFGGTKEVTISKTTHSTRVAGIVSTNPAYLMNAGQANDTTIQLALLGRVPCQVVGQIRKGDQLVSSDIPGVATAMDYSQYQPGCVIGKALENHESDDIGVVEVVVGRV